ncbi:unnamed protein product [Rotaria sordida]|uniref:DUF4704 domain-containing protein n=1 Tax=Rotaria sordida TaxID=392033 RepID=A0A819EZB3_9BILA|nr:unnamed protein product [Rotaria sordida]CAF3857343.1 unnamed protein product [Rotaria sordida]
MSTLCELIERSYTIQYQKASKQHINMDVLNSLISLIIFFVKIKSKNSPLLLKQLFVHIFFNPAIWIYCSIDYSFKPKGLDGNRLTREQIIEMRHYMLLYLKQFVISSSGTQEEELQAILNYLHTDDNLIDVLDMTVNLMSEHSRTMVPAFDRRDKD